MSKLVINIETLDEIKKMGGAAHPELLSKLIKSFLKDSRDQIESIDEAVAKNDPVAVVEAAHKLKSSSISMGADKLAAICCELEMLGKHHTLEDCPSKSEAIKRAFEEAHPLFEKFI